MSEQSYSKTASGILVPQAEKPVGVRCGFCPRIIFKENEAKGRLFMAGDKPICAVCRVLKGKMGKRILNDKKKYLADVNELNKTAQQKADDIVAQVASKSIKDTKTAIKK